MVLVITTTLFLIVTAWLGATISKNSLFNSQNLANSSRYLAENALQYTIFKISNDEDWLESFKTVADWQETIENENVFLEGQSWQVKIQNTDLGQADIFATSTIKIGTKNYREIINARITTVEDGSIVLNYD
jgi:hypothetical protein